MLKELPETLDETYERMLREINKANWDHAHRLLQCLTVAVRPLRVAELAEVLAIDFGIATREGTSKLNTDWRWEDNEEAVLTACSSLISIVNDDDDDRSRDDDRHRHHDSRVVQFSHFSVKEYLTSSRIAHPSACISRFHILLEPAHTILAKACLGVLLQLDELVDEHNVNDMFPLVRYAAEHWVDHAQFENISSHIREEMKLLFDPNKPYFASWLQVHDIGATNPLASPLGSFAVSSYGKSSMATPLYYAALCGFHDPAEQLIIKHPVQVQGDDNRTLLYGASLSGHLEIVEWLLGRGANPNVRNGYGRTALHPAAQFGHAEVCRLLLQHKTYNNAQSNDGKTPLHLASQEGHVNVARLLLERGADVNAQDNTRYTPFHHASMFGCLEVARLLVEHGADIAAEDDEGKTAFQVASEKGHHDIAKFLWDNHQQNVPEHVTFFDFLTIPRVKKSQVEKSNE